MNSNRAIFTNAITWNIRLITIAIICVIHFDTLWGLIPLLGYRELGHKEKKEEVKG